MVVTAGVSAVAALMLGKNTDLTMSAFAIYLEAKEYLHIRDLFANLTQSYPRLDFIYDDTNVEQYDSATITCLWDKQLAVLLCPREIAARFGAPRFNAEMVRHLPKTAVAGSVAGVLEYDPVTGQPMPTGSDFGDDEWLMACIPEKVVHLRPEPAMPATVKLLLVNTSRYNQVIPTAGGVDKQEYVVATLPPPSPTGYAVFNSRSDIRWLPLGGRRRDFVFGLRWADGTPLIFDTNQVAIGLLCV